MMVQINDAGNDGIHWVEKYRPKTLDDLISNRDIVSTIEKFIDEDHMPHLLFYGPPGTGKTSTILACARKLYKEKEFSSMVLELNASDDRGIGIVRGPIQAFASCHLMFKNRKAFKLIILDEADAMTHDAQNALRRTIEQYTTNVRFCFICNYLNKIIPAIQSRCTKFRFAPLASDQIRDRLDYIVKQETINITDDGKMALIELSAGDMRRVLNILQSTSTAFNVVNEDNVYKCCGIPTKAEANDILQWITEDSFADIYRKIIDLQSNNGYSLIDIIRAIHQQVLRIDFPKQIKLDLMIRMADIEVNLCSAGGGGGGTEKVQLAALIASFQCIRDSLHKN